MMTIAYVHPPVDNVSAQYWVEPLRKPEHIVTIGETNEEAVDVYMHTYRTKFSSKSKGDLRRAMLKRFLRHLKARGHSMKLADLNSADGQHFLDTLVNTFNGLLLSPSKMTDYRGALRSFSRFLADSGVLGGDIFFTLIVE